MSILNKSWLAGLLLLTLCAPARADLATLKKTCAACHRPDTTLVGPAFQAVAARYRQQPGAEDALVAKLQKGSQGSWGAAAMPPAPHIAESDARKLVRWVLQH